MTVTRAQSSTLRASNSTKFSRRMSSTASRIRIGMTTSSRKAFKSASNWTGSRRGNLTRVPCWRSDLKAVLMCFFVRSDRVRSPQLALDHRTDKDARVRSVLEAGGHALQPTGFEIDLLRFKVGKHLLTDA